MDISGSATKNFGDVANGKTFVDPANSTPLPLYMKSPPGSGETTNLVRLSDGARFGATPGQQVIEIDGTFVVA